VRVDVAVTIPTTVTVVVFMMERKPGLRNQGRRGSTAVVDKRAQQIDTSFPSCGDERVPRSTVVDLESVVLEKIETCIAYIPFGRVISHGKGACICFILFAGHR